MVRNKRNNLIIQWAARWALLTGWFEETERLCTQQKISGGRGLCKNKHCWGGLYSNFFRICQKMRFKKFQKSRIFPHVRTWNTNLWIKKVAAILDSSVNFLKVETKDVRRQLITKSYSSTLDSEQSTTKMNSHQQKTNLYFTDFLGTFQLVKRCNNFAESKNFSNFQILGQQKDSKKRDN